MRRVAPGRPEPLGVTPVSGGVNVAWPSAHASAIVLCLYDEAGEREIERIALPGRTGDVHHAFVEGLAPGQRYGLRVHGPWAPKEGHRFNAAKLLVDPWATALDRPFAWHESLSGATADDVTPDGQDSAPFVPKAIVPAPGEFATGPRPRIAPGRRIVYELHVRGFTKAHPDIPESLRGTFAGLAHPAAIAHLGRLGVTTVELMPVAAAIDERHLPPLGLTNYWGYNPVALLAPEPRLAPGGMAEVAACVRALHEAGLEVLLDVVLNHTGEGDERGPTVSLRGLDNATFHRLREDDRAAYANDAGCGNSLALENSAPLRLALDALRHWAGKAGVDGFRYDLATTLARGPAGFDPHAPFLSAVRQDPVLRELVHIAEPWDIGPGGHRLGAFPAGWAEWNDRYRDTVRRFWRGDGGLAGELATRIAGSADVFGAGRRSPADSLNFVTAHDGFTLADLVAHERKHNEANGEGNRDGTDANHAWNHGVEGATDDEAVTRARRGDVRALLATLLLSRGTPMLSHGDELGRTQWGNNNAYAQDNALSWIDWANADASLADFVGRLCALRAAHPALRAACWLTGESPDASAIADVEWRRPDGSPMGAGDWTDPAARALVAALYAPAGDGAPEDRVVIAFNASRESHAVRWPVARDGKRWRVAIDSASGAGGGEPSDELAARTVVLLVEDEAPGVRHGLEPGILDRLARAAGIAPRWHDVEGHEHVVTDDTRRALLAAMGLAATSDGEARERLYQLALAGEARRIPETLVVREGEAIRVPLAHVPGSPTRGRLRVTTERGALHVVGFTMDEGERDRRAACDGRTIVRTLVALPPLPRGVHALAIEDEPEAKGHLLVAPPACHRPAVLEGGRRATGLAAHLYALRGESGQGVGDFTTLVEASLATARAGGLVVGLNPLHALFAGDRDRASPYHPSDRRYLDPAYLDVMRLPGLAEAPEARDALMRLANRFGELEARSSVDWRGVWQAKRIVLEAAFTAFGRRSAEDPLRQRFERFVAEGGETLARFATFEALAEAHPSRPWPEWPAELRAPGSAHVVAFAQAHAVQVRYAMYLQWLCDRQLGDAARAARAGGLEIGFYRDLAVGCAPDGAEAWSQPGLHARGVSIGAPPDPFCRDGQVWTLPPPIPHALAGGGYAPFRALMAANMRHAGALRVDHAMGLARLFWVPDGGTGLDGAYVAHPRDDLLGALALESARAGCLVVGEDLGTVPEGFREAMESAGILSTRVLWFERDGRTFRAPAAWPAEAVACVSTHDLPPLAGWWAGADIEEREALGLVTAQAALAEWQARSDDKRALCEAMAAAGLEAPDPDSPQPPLAAVHAFLAQTPSALQLLQADDLAGESVALNLPGTDRERDNWRRRVRVKSADLWT
ncbi:MAG: glycogen debranching protein GlgX [Betaproteobacteria bacterium]|nr:glycogen debranching protein GlgX [Betaproteobacteria bacterium]